MQIAMTAQELISVIASASNHVPRQVTALIWQPKFMYAIGNSFHKSKVSIVFKAS